MSTPDPLTALRDLRRSFARDVAGIEADHDLAPADRQAAVRRAHASAMGRHQQLVSEYHRLADDGDDDAGDEPLRGVDLVNAFLRSGGGADEARERFDESLLLSPPVLPR